MLPRATRERKARERVHLDGRSVEIQRLIGRALRQAVNLEALGERTLILDVDVLQADGGTRTAAITGGFVAVVEACRWLRREKLVQSSDRLIRRFVAAVSVALLPDGPVLDPCYEEDVLALADFNLVGDDAGHWIEVQGTAEQRPCRPEELNQILHWAREAIQRIIQVQQRALRFPERDIP